MAVGAAVGGVVSFRFGALEVEWAGVLSAACFIIAMIAELAILQRRPDQTWFKGRAVAESVKTLAWQYSIGGRPFRIGSTDKAADKLYAQQLTALLEETDRTGLMLSGSTGDQVTEQMKALRALPLTARKDIYRVQRLEDQQQWYAAKAMLNEKHGRQWTYALLILEVTGLLAGALRATGSTNIDLLGVIAAFVGAIAAWSQMHQHDTLSRAYALAAQELSLILVRLPQTSDEATWASFVHDAETAISREHTMWAARRGATWRLSPRPPDGRPRRR